MCHQGSPESDFLVIQYFLWIYAFFFWHTADSKNFPSVFLLPWKFWRCISGLISLHSCIIPTNLCRFNVLELVESLVWKRRVDDISFEVKISIVDESVRIPQSAEQIIVVCLSDFDSPFSSPRNVFPTPFLSFLWICF